MDTNLKIFDNEFTFLGDIEDYISFYFVRSFFQAKEFQLVVPIKYIDILKDGNYIYLNKYKSMIIEDITIDEDKYLITVKGRDIKSIIERRITLPPAGLAYDEFKGNAESAIKYYVDKHCINPINASRKIPYLSIAVNKNRGLSVNWQSRFKNLTSEIESIARVGEVGWFLYLEPKAKKLIFEVETGINRIAAQSVNSRVIFSSEYSNISNTTHTSSSISYKNIGYVGGQGEGVGREVQEVKKKDAAGLDRREIFIDARDISASENLKDRALSKLSAYDYVNNTESTILDQNLLYERDWDLGDLVTVKSNLESQNLRITEVREIYEGSRVVEIVVGNIGNTVIEQMNTDISSTPSEAGTSQQIWYPTIVDGVIRWELTSYLKTPLGQSIRGPQGIQGVQGLKGDQGATGTQGVIGAQGIEGLKGVQGIQGVKGDTGAQGIQGDKGDTGAQGIQGSTGLQGIQGVQGVAGDGTPIVIQSIPPTQTTGAVWIQI